jgi:SulP family sulfate permease
MLAIVHAYRAGLFHKKFFFRNMVAGVIVGVLTAPLAIAFAIASGAQPEQGLYTAIIASLSVALFGGTTVQIAGPTGALVMMLSSVVQYYGAVALPIVTILSGLILIVMGVLKLGDCVRLIPTTVVHGFSFGIGISILVNQFKEFFGLSVFIPATSSFFTKVSLLIIGLPDFSINTTLLSLLGIGLIILSGRISNQIPAPLTTLFSISILNYFLKFQDVATIESSFGAIPQHLPILQIPFVSWSLLFHLIGPACSIALLSSIETLLSASATDKFTGDQHRPNQELIGLGLGNMISPFFGGFVATGTLTRTMTSLRYGANSPLAAIVHAIILISVLFVLAPAVNEIPLCSLAAILYVVAFKMINIRFLIGYLKRLHSYDVFIFIVTFFLTVFFDLSTAIIFGVMLSSAGPYVALLFFSLKRKVSNFFFNKQWM